MASESQSTHQVGPNQSTDAANKCEKNGYLESSTLVCCLLIIRFKLLTSASIFHLFPFVLLFLVLINVLNCVLFQHSSSDNKPLKFISEVSSSNPSGVQRVADSISLKDKAEQSVSALEQVFTEDVTSPERNIHKPGRLSYQEIIIIIIICSLLP
jgi:hypothetical protein